MKLQLGISTCPNDTFMFHAIIHGRIDLLGLEFEIQYLDVQELNQLLAARMLDVSKASYHAALHIAADYGVLRSGSALGKGVGPIMVCGEDTAQLNPDSVVACPGAWTTATLLFRLAHPECRRIEQSVFSSIMPAVCARKVDYGVVIHEGRFTYEQHGLTLAGDLGEFWEEETSTPLPLGGILAKRDLADSVHQRLTQVIRNSIEYAHRHRAETLPTMQRHAQELDEAAIWPHVDLYVNDFSPDLGDVGIDALQQMENLARTAGVVPGDSPRLHILA